MRKLAPIQIAAVAVLIADAHAQVEELPMFAAFSLLASNATMLVSRPICGLA
jgi:hypothetical protein